MSGFDFRAYGALVNGSGQLIRETSTVYIRDIESELETGRAGPDMLASFIDAPKRVLEQREEQLSSLKPPKELKGFHNAYLKGVRATILRWGSIRRAGLESSAQFNAMALEQFGRASLELKPLAETYPSLLMALQLDPMLCVAVLWKDRDWLEYAVATESHPEPSVKVCGSCGHSVTPTAKFCTECGARSS
jgi:hypothetical protein